MIDLQNEYGKSELALIPIRNLDLVKTPWNFSRGAKTYREYLDNDDNVIIRVDYNYTMSADNRSIMSYTEVINWLDTQGTSFMSKSVTELLNIKNLKKLNRDIRQGRIDYLESGAEDLRNLANTLPEPYKAQYTQVADSIDYIFDFYEADINHYIQRGIMDFENAVNNENDPTMLSILSIPVRQPDAYFPNGLTVIESINHQLTGIIP